MSVAPSEWVRAWKPTIPGIHEVFHARFVDHAYPPHTHDTWTVFIVDEGAIRYDLDARRRGSDGARVTILPPHVVHDGRAASHAGFRKRVLYIGTEVLPERLIGRAVDEPDLRDPDVRRNIVELHGALAHPGELLEAESRLALLSQDLRRHLGGAIEEPFERAGDDLADELRDLLDERRFDPMTLADAGRVLRASQGHLVRCFTRTFGIAPHRYVIARRIEAARQRLLDGEPVAMVASGVGFHDQAHLTRHFKRHVGTTPARYAATSGAGR